ncbi:hypothetical protein NX722_25640 [Endozoicomonas gorgoniicola]|uniref:HipA-like kinase domain-containing protein n=1 Tax=Endozoicomonas gorgoniicola TaxID=1234144 RepID=A0ABT3N2T6_9GAMM|nr:HipA family kinase [Endozoicomonas gorgoniicola]MCW7555950.1 hypothetical protein [Endozoicomonas gorgoniicola]
MEPLVQIEEVLTELKQGYSGVFRCLGADQQYYYVKGHNVGRDDQAREWICGKLAQAFGLPIADFCLAEIDECLHQYLPDSMKKIGSGVCFASREVKHAEWLQPNLIAHKVSAELQSDLLVFDWWVKNGDRNYGNPNLLWVSNEEKLAVIDHNLAFDSEVTEESFFEHHIFSEAKHRIFTDLAHIAEYRDKIAQAISEFQPAVDVIKEVWPWRDLEETRPFELDSAALLAILEEYKNNDFWSMK